MKKLDLEEIGLFLCLNESDFNYCSLDISERYNDRQDYLVVIFIPDSKQNDQRIFTNSKIRKKTIRKED